MSELFNEFMQVTGVSESDARTWFKRLADQVYMDASPDCPDDVGVYDAYDAGVEEMRRSILEIGA